MSAETNALFDRLRTEVIRISSTFSPDNEKYDAYNTAIQTHWPKIRAAAVKQELLREEAKKAESVQKKPLRIQPPTSQVVVDKIKQDFFYFDADITQKQKYDEKLETFQTHLGKPNTDNLFTIEFLIVLQHYARAKRVSFAEIFFNAFSLEAMDQLLVKLCLSVFLAVDKNSKNKVQTTETFFEFEDDEKEQHVVAKPIIFATLDETFDPLMTQLAVEEKRGYLKTLFFSGDKFGRADIKRDNRLFLDEVKNFLKQSFKGINQAILNVNEDEKFHFVFAEAKKRIGESLSKYPLAGTGHHLKPSRTMKLLENVMLTHGLIEDADAFKAFVAEARNTYPAPTARQNFK